MINEPSPKIELASDSNDAWLNSKLALRSELTIDVRKQGDRFVAIIEDPIRAKFFQVGHVEYHFISMLDGSQTIAQIIEAMRSERAIQKFTPESAKTICSWLASMNLLTNPREGTSQRLSQAAQVKQNQKWLALLNPICFRVNLLNPDKSLRYITPYCQWLFNPWWLPAWVILAFVALGMIYSQGARFAESAVGILAPGRWLWLLIIWVLLKVVHEAAHGVACQRYGGNVRQAGILFLLLAPLAFVDVTSSWRFTSRRKRIVVSAAGMYVELFIAFVAAIIWANQPPGLISDIAYNIVVMAGVSTILFNANPLIRFDGYYILADLLGIVNLYSKGQQWFADRFRHWVLGFPKDKNICPNAELGYVATYGVMAFCWRVVLCASLLLVACTLLNGAGLILAIIGGIFWVLLPVYMHLKKTRQLAQVHSINYRRLACCSMAACGFFVFCFFWLQAPAITRAPAIVQFKDEQILRAAADGFLVDILVGNGQAVRQGDHLLRLENPDLQLEYVQLQQAAAESRIQARIHRQRGELSLYQAEQSQLDSLEQQLTEKREQLAQLIVRAPIDGFVFRRGLENLIHSFVKQGDPILRIARSDSKEIMVSIDQDQIKSVRQNQHLPVRVTFGGLPIINANISSIRPRASDHPTDVSLCAVAGGPLAVRPVESNADTTSLGEDSLDKYRLLVPRFTAELTMAVGPADQLWAGQRGTAFLYGREISMGSYIFLKCRNWVRQKLEKATQIAL